MPGPRPTPGPGPNRPNPGPRPGGHRIPGNRPLPGGGVVHRDPNGNVITRNHPGRINTVNNRINTVMRRDPRIGGVVNRHGGWYRTNRYPYSVTRHNWYYGHYNNWRVRYSPWWRHGFYGGYYWPYRPILDINIYFYNPMIYWFYVPVWDDYYYRVWYERYYDQYPELRTPFPYAGIFFPTEEFKDLNISVSGMDIRSQINYRHAIVSLHDQMRSQFSIILGTQIAFGQNDIVVTHYQFMPNDNGIVVEGFANYQQQSLPFKGYLDLNSGSTWVFTTASDGSSPSPQEMDSLNQLNTRIEAAGGVVEGEALNRNRMNFFDDNRNEIIDENVNE
ncbi:MAG: hypothetical protein A4S09_11880 [Proteobacteria bacterium SG_bin7]|nr:MAG: hypothetical protein A4S09_11880 [Proteobacteria bacterium SG_bin7]